MEGAEWQWEEWHKRNGTADMSKPREKMHGKMTFDGAKIKQ